MTDKLVKTLESVWYAAGPAQFLMYGVWVVVLSGMFGLDGTWQLLCTFWKFMGAFVIVTTVWGTLKQRQLVMLLSTLTAVVVGSVYTSRAMVFVDVDVNIHRAMTQSHYMVIAVLVIWGYYLANLTSRQIMEFKKAGISDE